MFWLILFGIIIFGTHILMLLRMNTSILRLLRISTLLLRLLRLLRIITIIHQVVSLMLDITVMTQIMETFSWDLELILFYLTRHLMFFLCRKIIVTVNFTSSVNNLKLDLLFFNRVIRRVSYFSTFTCNGLWQNIDCSFLLIELLTIEFLIN